VAILSLQVEQMASNHDYHPPLLPAEFLARDNRNRSALTLSNNYLKECPAIFEGYEVRSAETPNGDQPWWRQTKRSGI
jgi:hypothetical protein